MNTASVRLLQQKLAEAGLYSGAIDGQRGPLTNAGVAAALSDRAAHLPGDWKDWSDKRKAVACLQLFCSESDIDAGPTDGWWGPQTEFAVGSLASLVTTGSLPQNWRDEAPTPLVSRNNWPREDYPALSAFFGPHGRKRETPTPPPALVMVNCPWTLRLAWNRRQTTRQIGCNAKVADSLSRVLDRVWNAYGDAEIRRLRLDIYGGCYNPRTKRGGTSWSTHAWGIALDWDPVNNQLRWGRDRATLARPEYDEWWKIWEAEGWCSLGRQKNFDWMHVQATSV